MTEQSLTQVLNALYTQHDNAQVLQVLQNCADLVLALWQKNIFYPNLTTDQFKVSPDLSLVLANEQVLVTREVTVTSQVEQLQQLNILPDYMRIFLHMLWQEQEIPTKFEQAFHKEWPKALLAKEPGILEHWQNTWLWDDKSAQAMVILKRKQKKQLRKKQSHAGTVWRWLKTTPKLFQVYKKTLGQAYQTEVCIKDRIGIALHPAVDYQEQEMKLLEKLGDIPVLIRFLSHQPVEDWLESIAYVKRLSAKNVKVSIALLQDRNGVINNTHWQKFLETIIPAVHQDVDWIEVGHAVNRVKWGIWTPEEYTRLFNISYTYKKQYSNLRLIGPAVIDFEWFRIIDFVKALPKKVKLFALSQHLYVDRRGAPENFQGKFSTLEKCAMGKALAKTLSQTDDRFIISEFNWPLQGTGIYSPIGSPYTTPEWFVENPGVTEQQYAHYLIRYLTIAITSSFVEQAFCWRLSAHGYGLVDDLDDFRCRPAYYALQFFIKLLGEATFCEKKILGEGGYCFKFKNNTQTVLLAWTSLDKPIECEMDETFVAAYNYRGESISSPEKGRIVLTNEMVYYVC